MPKHNLYRPPNLMFLAQKYHVTPLIYTVVASLSAPKNFFGICFLIPWPHPLLPIFGHKISKISLSARKCALSDGSLSEATTVFDCTSDPRLYIRFPANLEINSPEKRTTSLFFDMLKSRFYHITPHFYQHKIFNPPSGFFLGGCTFGTFCQRYGFVSFDKYQLQFQTGR